MKERTAATTVNYKSLTAKVLLRRLRRLQVFVVQKTARTGEVRAGEEGKLTRFTYDARAARRCGTTGTTAFMGLATFARAVARARFLAFTMKQRSSARSTCASISSAFCRITSEISEIISALAR